MAYTKLKTRLYTRQRFKWQWYAPALYRLTYQVRATPQSAHNTGATVGITSYELDIWGRVRNQSEQALQNLYTAGLLSTVRKYR
ncbi:hypothetical protein ACOBV9_20050 (plasmid) [Pseudoalteromonas espejiana]